MKKKIFSFTLVEIIVTVTILSLGIVFVYQGFLTSLGANGYCKNYLVAQNWIDQKFWNTQKSLLEYHSLFTQKREGNIKINGKEFSWQFDYSLIAGSEAMDLYDIQLWLYWKEGKRSIKLVRATYFRNIKEK